MRLNRTLAAGLAIPIIVALSGCAGDDGSADKADEPAEGAIELPIDLTADIKVDEALAATVPKEYVTEGIVVGHAGEYMPMFTESSGEFRGADADLMRAAGATLGIDVQFSEVSWDGLIPSIKAERIDVIAATMADYPERQAEIDFIDYFELGVTMLVKKGNPEGIESIDDLCGVDVALTRGTGAAAAVQQQSDNCEENGEPPVNISLFPDSNTALIQLETGRADVMTNDLPAATYAAATIDGGKSLETVDEPLYAGLYYGFGTRKEDTALRDALQGALQKLVDDGTYGEILTGYGIESGAVDEIAINAGEEAPFS